MSVLNLLPFPEAQTFWKGKTPMTTEEYQSIGMSAKNRAFTVSGITKQEVLSAIHEKLGQAISKGMSFEEFKSSDIWKGTGFEEKGYRLDNIYRTNIQSALMAGRYEQMMKSKLKQYWMYSAVNDSRTRPVHRALHGKVYHRDHPFWDEFYPPNGYRCRCSVIAVNEKQMERRGLKISSDDIVGNDLEITDPETGEVTTLKLKADSGFAGRPTQGGLEALSPELAEGTLKDLITKAHCPKNFADDCRIPLKNVAERHIHTVSKDDIMPKGLKPEEYVSEFLKAFGLKINESKVITVPGVRLPFVISKMLFIDKLTGGWKIEKSGREQYIKLMAQTILNPWEVWTVPAELEGRQYSVARLIRLFKTDNGSIGGFGVFNLIGRRYLPATVFMPNAEKNNERLVLEYLEKQRVGVLAYREK